MVAFACFQGAVRRAELVVPLEGDLAIALYRNAGRELVCTGYYPVEGGGIFLLRQLVAAWLAV